MLDEKLRVAIRYPRIERVHPDVRPIVPRQPAGKAARMPAQSAAIRTRRGRAARPVLQVVGVCVFGSPAYSQTGEGKPSSCPGCIASVSFISKLMITCCSQTRSPKTVGTAGANSVRNDTRWLVNPRCTSEIISAASSDRRSRSADLSRLARSKSLGAIGELAAALQPFVQICFIPADVQSLECRRIAIGWFCSALAAEDAGQLRSDMLSPGLVEWQGRNGRISLRRPRHRPPRVPQASRCTPASSRR